MSDDYYYSIYYVFLSLQCGTILGKPEKTVRLGETQVTYAILLEYLHELGEEKYTWVKICYKCNISRPLPPLPA